MGDVSPPWRRQSFSPLFVVLCCILQLSLFGRSCCSNSIKRGIPPVLLCSSASESDSEASARDWPNSIIPYDFDETLSTRFTAVNITTLAFKEYLWNDVSRESIISAMGLLEHQNCFIFIPRTTEVQYITFRGNGSERCCIGQLSGSHPTVLAANSCPDLTISEILRIILGISLDSKLHDLNNTSSFSSHAINGESATNDGQASAEDHSVSRPGNALCRRQCGGIVSANVTLGDHLGISGRGNVSSPAYPSYYPLLLDCFWKIRAPEGYTVRVMFNDLDIEPSRTCEYDFLQVTNLNSKGRILRNRKLCSAPPLSEVNLNSFNRELHLETEAVVLHLHSDSTYTGRGFRLSYELLDKDGNYTDPCSVGNGGCDQICTSDAYRRHTCSCREGYSLTGQVCRDINECKVWGKPKGGCQQRCRNTEGSYQCYCRIGYRLNYDKRTCSACILHHNDSSGTIQSSNFPAPYHHQQNCIWMVSPWPGHRLRIFIKNLDIFPSHKCKTDYLKFEHGYFPNQRRMCGYFYNITYILDKTTSFRLRSKTANQYHSGFRLTYTQVPEDELSLIDINYVNVQGIYVRYKKRRWLATLRRRPSNSGS